MEFAKKIAQINLKSKTFENVFFYIWMDDIVRPENKINNDYVQVV